MMMYLFLGRNTVEYTIGKIDSGDAERGIFV